MTNERVLRNLITFEEGEILRSSGSTARPWQECDETFEITSLPKSSSVLDVGGGGSDMTAHLITLGFNAYAIDPRYQFNGRDISDAVVNFTRHFSNDPEAKRSKEAFEHFRESARQNPDRYKAGFATDIPFDDESFDVVFSLNAVTEYLDLDKAVLFKAVDECLRVTKHGGSVQLHPFQDALVRAEEIGDEEMKKYRVAKQYKSGLAIRNKNQEALIKRLEQRGIKFQLVPVVGSRHKKLVIPKY